jgi:hypothetical protein
MSNIVLTIWFLLCSNKIIATADLNICRNITFESTLYNGKSFGFSDTLMPLNASAFDYATLERMINRWLYYYTNLYRKQNGRDTLAYAACLNEAAANHAHYLCNESLQQKQLVLMHEEDSNSVWFNGYSPSVRSAKAGCNLLCGENALYTGLSIFVVADLDNHKQLDHMAQEIARNMVYDIWQHSKGHRENMLNTQYKLLRTAVSVINANFKHCNNGNKETFIYLIAFAIQDFGMHQ